MKNLVFISNGNKPKNEDNNKIKKIEFSNMRTIPIKCALEFGYNVYTNIDIQNNQKIECDLPINFYDGHIYRSTFDLKNNYKAYNNLNKLIKDKNIDIIHCNTPVGGLIGRICGKKNKVRKILYTAHGFHFYKGAPLLNNTIFKWSEMLMAHWTDAIITMNKEDYEAAKKFKLRNNGKVFFVHGVGIDVEKYNNIKVDVIKLKKSLGIKSNYKICISIGDLNKNKNFDTVIKAIKRCNDKNIHYFICGIGPKEIELKKLAKRLHLENQIHFLGYRNDIKELLSISDLFIISSKREGLSRSLMEAMASGLPCIASNIRGNVDLIKDGKGGFIVNPDDYVEYSNKITRIINDNKLSKIMSEYNLDKIKNYDSKIVKKELEKIYREVL